MVDGQPDEVVMGSRGEVPKEGGEVAPSTTWASGESSSHFGEVTKKITGDSMRARRPLQVPARGALGEVP